MRLKKRKEGEDQDSAPHQENEDADSNKGEDREGETTELDDGGPTGTIMPARTTESSTP